MDRKRVSGIAAYILAATLFTVFVPSVVAQNGYSFIGVENSTIDYRLAEIAPVLGCGEFAAMSDTNLSVISATLVPANEDIPEHCRIDGLIAPEVRFQVNMPSLWNGRFYMHGNGGYAGLPPDSTGRSMHRNRALSNGFATTYTNTGHDADAEPLASFAHNNQAKEIDYAYRAVHLTAQAARDMISDYYGRPSDYNYWDGCSTGGRQGLMSAQRFPEDFDGIVVGAPVLDFTGTMLWGLWNGRALLEGPISLDQVAAVGEAIYEQCDAIDGLEDGLIDDPRDCDFDPTVHLQRCEAFGGEAACFSDAQIGALAKIYRGVESQGEIIFPGQPMGAEIDNGWAGWLITADGPNRQLLFAQQFLKFLAYPADNPDYDWTQFDFDEDPSKIVEIRKVLDATNPDLTAFRNNGGKIISYFGWADTALSAQMGVNYYEAVMDEMGGEETRDFYRFYTVPGMFHCRGGVGVDRIDAMTRLVNWVEGGEVPESIIATREEDDVTSLSRPLCPYPQAAEYSGTGNADQATSFSCSDN